MDRKRAVLVTGGTGYLGQFLIQHLLERTDFEVTYTYSSTGELHGVANVKAYKVDFVTGEGLAQCLSQQYDAIVSTAALSQPGACKSNPDLARAINVPRLLLQHLNTQRNQRQQQQQQPQQQQQQSQQQQQQQGQATADGAGQLKPLFIHLSTDQVYDGSKAWWRETDECHPVNDYGASKLEAETFIQSEWSSHVILRCSIIYGDDPPYAAVRGTRFLQFLRSALKDGTARLFTDQYRCPVFVDDVVRVMMSCMSAPHQHLPYRIFNVGGPERLSRYDMGVKVAEHMGVCVDTIAKDTAADKLMDSPLDISMDISRLATLNCLPMTSMQEALQKIWPTGSS